MNFIYSFGIIWIFLATQACSPERDEYSFPPMIYDEQAFLREIEAADDLFAINETRSNYIIALKKSEAVTNALQEKWCQLTVKIKEKGAEIGKLCDEAELVEFDFQKIGKDRFRLYFLFRVIEEFQSNYSITTTGRLADPSLLPEPSRKQGYMLWRIKPLPPTKFWEVGEYIVISAGITAPDFPFELRVNFDSSQGIHGTQIPLGVMRQIDKLPINREDILAENDPFQLWEWLRCCHGRSGPKAELVRQRYRELLSRLQPKARISDDIEFYDWTTRAVGPGLLRIYLLFKALDPISSNFRLALHGLVDPSDRDKLSEPRRRQNKKSEQWLFLPYPGTSYWRKGEFFVITREIPVQPITYDLFALFYDRRKGIYGSKFQLGKITVPKSAM